MQTALGVVLCLCAVAPPVMLAQTVFGSSSEGTFWGINMDMDAATVKYPLYPGFTRATGSMSYDQHSGHSLFEHFHPNTLSYGPMCSNSPGITPKFLFNITNAVMEQKDLGDSFLGVAGAFAMHRSKIYFLHYGAFSSETRGFIHRFQVRVLQSCEECGVDPYADDHTGSTSMSMHYIVHCSKAVVELPLKIDGMDEEPKEYHLGKVLRVVEGKGNDESDLTFYFQVGKISQENNVAIMEMLLYKVEASGSHKLIHTQMINNRFQAWDLHLIGAVDYLNGVLCWTTADRVLCIFKEGNQPTTIVKPGAAVGKSICTGTSPQHLNDISGVAILKAEDTEQTVLFGCSPQTPEVRGSGIVYIGADSKVMVLKAFKAEDDALSAASLVTVKSLHGDCSFEPRPVLCVRLQQLTTETTPPQIPTQPTRFAPEDPENPGSETGSDGVDNEPSGEPEATEEDKVVDDGMAVVGGDTASGAPCVRWPNCGMKYTLFQLLVVIFVTVLLS